MDHKRRIAWRPLWVCIRIARLVLPSLKVHCLGWADTEQDSQNLRVGDPLSQLSIKAGATLLNKAEVEPRSEGNCFDEFGVGCVSICSGNCRMQPRIQSRDCLSKFD